MTYPGSRQTRAAREVLSAAQDAWKAHLRDCIDCRRAANRRRPAERCADGTALAAAVTAAAEHWRDEQELDRAPIPGQAALW